MPLVQRKTKVCNVIAAGDCHDQSIQNFLETTDFFFYELYRLDNGRFRITGCDIQKEVKDARKADEEKSEKKVAADGRRVTKSKSGGKHGTKRKTGK